jgi:DNA-binding PadR family transcriptional regulator
VADTIFREFFLGFVRIHVLHHAAGEPIYGLGMIEELARHGYTLSPGTMYPLLHAMHHAGYLRQIEQHVNGRPRKYYRITPKGRRVLDEARGKIEELVDEALPRQSAAVSIPAREALRRFKRPLRRK